MLSKSDSSKGNCALCGEHGDLTFEHVPPRIAFNKNTRYQTVPHVDLLQSDDPLNPTYKAKIQQGGTGYYSLCARCNNFLGKEYVIPYTSYSNSFIDLAKKVSINHFVIEMHDFEALRVFKQIVSMFLSLNGWEFSKNHRELAEFVLSPSQVELSPKYRFFEYLNSEEQLRHLAVSVKGNLATGISIFGSEITFPPLGHVMTINFNGSLPYHQEITHFKNCGNQKGSYQLQMNRLPTVLPILLDYRTRAEIAKNISEAKSEL
jgi:hypothetical protein